MTALLVVVVIIVVLGLVLAFADRALAALAEHKASEYLTGPFGQPPRVRVHAVPFLTQALRGRYRDVEVSGGGLQLGEITGATAYVHLSNCYLSPRDLLAGQAQELPCEHLAGTLVLPYGELARVSRVPGLSLTYSDAGLVASASLPVPGINQLARVSGRAALSVDGGTVWLRVSGLSVAGISLTALVIGQLLPRMNVPIPLPALPWGLRLDDLQPAAAGLVVTGSAEAVVLGRGVRPENRDERRVG